jgi:hypothetical protein
VTTDDVELEQPVEIVQIPDKDNLEEWNEGIYDVKPVDTVTDEATSINWKKLLITKVQQKEIINVKNTAVIVTDGWFSFYLY